MQARADSEFAAEAGADLADGEEDGQENKPTGPAWEGTDRDYSYEELLGKSFNDRFVMCAVMCMCFNHSTCMSVLWLSSPWQLRTKH